MAPLVPHIISNEFNFILAIIIGIGFGFALEQAGFGSTKKLVGLFYGYDFTVLKVFMTAGVTAMVGVILLNHMELLDVSIIYINPTFLWAALIGGGIMGGGFIIGGFCPGTSVCAAATGKVDGMAFVFGAILGVFAFGESFPLIKDMYYAENWGDLLVFEMMGLSREVFGLIMVIGATVIFILVQKIENRVNGKKVPWLKSDVKKYSVAVGLAIVVIVLTMITPTRGELMHQRIEESLVSNAADIKTMDADKLAYELMHQYYQYNVIDVRSKEAFEKFHIPTAINVPLNELNKQENRYLLQQNIKTNVFYGDDVDNAKRALLISKYYGKAENAALSASANDFNVQFFQIAEQNAPATKDEMNTYNFRVDAATKLTEIAKAVANLDKPVVKKVSRVKGGCS
ncbi:YeeE/YedE thiosulfate transporter family protein [Carboxylicivirga sp. N1Y90]|uniref:YeeE/YedE thiosulfate transporter family protein n=1 Tax=Carboxylicivirga fragile TaxID=3417571 RepID=UPI003D34004B|nr:rhodanese-like domain-containing protein [Marinilabiliaceae bacterium N1Y90]